MQLPFCDAQEPSKRKRTRRVVFLDAMNHVVPWKALLARIAPLYQKAGRPGRTPDAQETMRRIHSLQQWVALSDPAMEEALSGQDA